MSQKHRLPPQPTDTRLARFVGRMIERFPLAFRETVRDLRAEREALRIEQYKLRCDLARADQRYYDDIIHVRRDMQRMADNIESIFTIDLLRAPSMFDPIMNTRISLRFEPLNIQIPCNDNPRIGISGRTAHFLREAAHELANMQAERMAEKIYEISLTKYNAALAKENA